MDDAVARDGAAAVDSLFALEGGEPPSRLADQDRGRTDIIGLHPRVDHSVRAAEENLPIAVEIGESASRIACSGQPDQRVAHPRVGELLEAAMGHGGVCEGRYVGHPNRRAVVCRAVALHGRKKVSGSRHIGNACNRYAP